MPPLSSDIEYAESGSGPALLFMPGAFSTGAASRGVIEHLGEGYRVITTSLLGYGATAERRPAGNRTMAQQVEVLEATIAHIGAPVHVIGHSYGGASVITHAISGALTELRGFRSDF